jgi:hypothetical protein
MGALNVYTNTLTNSSITIVASNNVVRVSVLCRQGVISVTGSSTFQGNSSSSVTLNVGQGITITSSTISTPIDGLVINAGSSGDIADLVISYQ